jgi:hypothetical protein
MRTGVKVHGITAVAKALPNIAAAMENEMDKVVQVTALDIANEIKRRILKGPATGILYIRGAGRVNKSRTHRASARGEAPATDTGTLASSIAAGRTGRMEAEVVSDVEYARYLEKGTRNIKPRPAWTPAYEMARGKFAARMQAAIRKAAGL